MRELAKIISIYIALISGISFAETISEKADNGTLEEITSIDQANKLLGTLSGYDRYDALLDLQGWNRADTNYMAGVTPLSVDDIEMLMPIAQGYRTSIIEKFTDSKRLKGELTIDQANKLLGTLSGRDRYYAVKDLFGSNRQNKNYIQTPISATDADQLMQNMSYRADMIKYIAPSLNKELSVEDVNLLLGGLTDTRDEAIKALADHSNLLQDGYTAKEISQMMNGITGKAKYYFLKATLLGYNDSNRYYIKTPVNAQDAIDLFDNTSYRGDLIKYLTDRGVYTDGEFSHSLMGGNISANTAELLIGGLDNNHKYNALKQLIGHNRLNKNYIQTPISATDADQLMQNMSYRADMIGLMTDNDTIVDQLNYSDANKVIGKLDGSYRVNAFKDLSGDNKLKKNYLVETLTIIKGVPFPQGPISFADKVIEYKPGKGVESPHNDSSVAIGLPGNTGKFCSAEVCNEVSLGVHGAIITQFIDNYLTTSGDDSLDLWIFETGSAVEATKVDVSVNGIDWIDVGKVVGATSGVDIDSFKDNGIIEDVKYRYVRLTDLKGESSHPYQGADIDAVGAISAATKEIRELVKTIEENNFVDFDVAFEGNHWRLQDVVKPELDKLGEVLSAHAFSKGSFELVGHVAGKGGDQKVCIDSRHQVVNNARFAMECWDTDKVWAQALSERRAQSVRDYLLKNFTIPESRIKAYGVGDVQHKFKDDPDNAGNRRVEVKFIKN